MATLKSRFLPKLSNVNDSDSSTDDDESGVQSKPLFVIDARPCTAKKDPITRPEITPKEQAKKIRPSSSLNPGIDLSGYFSGKPNETLKLLTTTTYANEVYEQNTVMKPGFEQQYSINTNKISRRQQKKRNKIDRESNAGNNWFNMPQTELTEEVKLDLAILKMRDALDPKRFYKRNSETQKTPKFFQIGTIVGTQADYHNSLKKKDRKNNLVEELMADADFKKWSKKKYSEVLKKNPFYLREKRKASRRKERAKREAKQSEKEKQQPFSNDD